ncbi:unnamed protein product, partial [marine sediment metagenome]
TIIVNPTAQVNDPTDQVVCNGDNTSVTFTTNRTGGTTTYTWTNDTPAIGLLAGGTGNIGAFAAVNAGTSPVTATITVTPNFNNGGVDCSGPSEDFTIIVNPTAHVNDPTDQVVCNGDNTAAVTFTTNRTEGTTTYTWTNDTPAIGLLAGGTGNIGAFAAVNTGTSPVVATIIVTPTFTNEAVGCAGPTKTFTITVNPTPTLSSTLTHADVCSNTLFSYNPTSATVGTTFNWSRAVVDGITPAGPTSGVNNPNETLINITSAPIAVTYQYTLAANDCNNVQDVIVNINPEPVGADDTDNTCSNLALNYDLQANIDGVNGVSSDFSWVAEDNTNVTGESTTAQTGDFITDNITNQSGLDQDVVYTVTPTGTNDCTGDPFTVTITIQT